MKDGFSLIEIIIVMGIIGLLATAAVVGYSSQQGSARDTRRFEDVKKISDALEFYFEDNGKYAPKETWYADTSIGASLGATPPSPALSDWAPNSDLRDLVTQNYLSSLPKDPINNTDYHYRFELDDQLRGYLIQAVKLEKKEGNANNGRTFTLISKDYIENENPD